jgi:hypothetical protein
LFKGGRTEGRKREKDISDFRFTVLDLRLKCKNLNTKDILRYARDRLRNTKESAKGGEQVAEVRKLGLRHLG